MVNPASRAPAAWSMRANTVMPARVIAAATRSTVEAKSTDTTCSTMSDVVFSPISTPPSESLTGDVHGKVGQDQVRPSPLDRAQALAHHTVLVDRIGLGGELDHRVFA